MKPWKGERESNKDAKRMDVQVRKREKKRAEVVSWLARLLGGHSEVQGIMPRHN